MYKLLIVTGDCATGRTSYASHKRYRTLDEVFAAGDKLSDEFDFKVMDVTTNVFVARPH